MVHTREGKLKVNFTIQRRKPSAKRSIIILLTFLSLFPNLKSGLSEKKMKNLFTGLESLHIGKKLSPGY